MIEKTNINRVHCIGRAPTDEERTALKETFAIYLAELPDSNFNVVNHEYTNEGGALCDFVQTRLNRTKDIPYIASTNQTHSNPIMLALERKPFLLGEHDRAGKLTRLYLFDSERLLTVWQDGAVVPRAISANPR